MTHLQSVRIGPSVLQILKVQVFDHVIDLYRVWSHERISSASILPAIRKHCRLDSQIAYYDGIFSVPEPQFSRLAHQLNQDWLLYTMSESIFSTGHEYNPNCEVKQLNSDPTNGFKVYFGHGN